MAEEPYYQKLGFKADPYSVKSPAQIPFEFIAWDRIDWKSIQEKVNLFLNDIKTSITTGMRIYGAWGSGKTWLIRFIEKEVSGNKNILTLYSSIPEVDKSFEAYYRTIIENFTKDKDNKEKIQQIKGTILSFFKEKQKEKQTLAEQDYKSLFEDEDIGKCFYEVFENTSDKRIASKWLEGGKLSSDERAALHIVNQNDNDLNRLRVLEEILGMLTTVFSSVILFSDQLESSEPRLSRVLSDTLRQFIDEFSEKLVIVCAYISEEGDNWIARGFTDALLTRLRYSVNLPSLEENSMVHFMTEHHKLYGGKDINPFTNESIKYLWKITKAERRYPRFIFMHCSFLAKKMLEEGLKEITPSFIDKYRNSLEYSQKTESPS